MKSLQQYFQEAREGGWAIGHFNFASADVLRAIVQGAQMGGAPCVMVGTSPGEAEFLGMEAAVALVGAIREASGFPVYLNADHFKSFDACRAAIDAGYDTVLFDGAAQPYDINVIETQRVWQYAQTKRGSYMVEGELGVMKGSSEVQRSITIGPEDFTKPEQAADFVRRTGVDRLAVVFGNIHGIVTDQKEKLDIDHLRTIIAAIPNTAVVLHGASGIPDDAVAASIAAGVTNVHFNTELRVAYQAGIQDTLSQDPTQTTPYKLFATADQNVRDLVAQKTRLFMGALQ